MPRAKPIPAYLEEFLAGIEAQALAGEDLDRVKVLREVEARHQKLIDIEDELAKHPRAMERFQRVWKRVAMGLEDGAINAARGGKASATTLLRGMGAITPGKRETGGNGRIQLDREHRRSREW